MPLTDLRLEAIVEILDRLASAVEKIAPGEVQFYERKPESEMMPHSDIGQPTAGLDNATAPVMGADPPWLVQCMDVAFAGMTGLIEAERLEVLRCAIAFANAQPPSAAEIDEAMTAYLDEAPCDIRIRMRVALVAAYKARGA